MSSDDIRQYLPRWVLALEEVIEESKTRGESERRAAREDLEKKRALPEGNKEPKP